MKKFIPFFIILFTQLTFAQLIVINSPYLADPSKAIGYVDSCATFWKGAFDSTLGGFYTNIDKYGNVIGTNKNMLSQSRDAYGYVRAFMLTGNETYLQFARAGLDFMYQHAWDPTNGGWYDELGPSGNVLNPSANKSAFNQHYALLGIAAYYEATGDTLDWNWLMRGYQHMENNLWDDRPIYFGYYDYGNFNWTYLSGKSFNATVDAITTHLLYLYLLTEDQSYKNRLLEIADNIRNHLVASMPGQVIGFAEEYDSDWNIDNNEIMTIMGHVLKSAWCLGRVYQLEQDPDYTQDAAYLIEDVLTKGYDHEFGGPYKDYNRLTGQMMMWGNPDTAKAWWQMEQAVTAGLEMYRITGDAQYFNMADETLDFFMKYFVDHEYGEVYENRTRYGGQAWNENKGGGGKAAYHSIELGYYTYLYGNLFVQNQPATLHYLFSPLDSTRTIHLTPLAIRDNELTISAVTLDSMPYNNFDPIARELYLDPNVGGHFTVTYEAMPVSIADRGNPENPGTFILGQNYPNPFNPSTTIPFTLARSAVVSLKIYNALGQEVRTLLTGRKDAGQYTLQWDGRDNFGRSVASGIYFCQLSASSGENRTLTRKMILMK
jgi:mannose/cellobiose epimerase-like protein (N-acyl-D-glucosamine 2-epimerase family)